MTSAAGKHYKFFSSNRIMVDAIKQCRDSGGIMAELKTAAEIAVLAQLTSGRQYDWVIQLSS